MQVCQINSRLHNDCQTKRPGSINLSVSVSVCLSVLSRSLARSLYPSISLSTYLSFEHILNSWEMQVYQINSRLWLPHKTSRGFLSLSLSLPNKTSLGSTYLSTFMSVYLSVYVLVTCGKAENYKYVYQINTSGSGCHTKHPRGSIQVWHNELKYPSIRR